MIFMGIKIISLEQNGEELSVMNVAISAFVTSLQSNNDAIFRDNLRFGTEKEITPIPWCRHQMETFSALLALCKGDPSVTGGFPLQRPVTRIFDVFLDLSLNKRLGKQSRRRWFETQSRSSWSHWNSTKNCTVANIMKFYVLTTNNATLALRVCGDENTSITPNHSRHPLPWRHKSVMAYQVTSHSTSRQFVQKLINLNNKATIVADPHYWSNANLWIPLKPLAYPSQRACDAYPHKGSVMWKAFPCHGVVMSHEDARVWVAVRVLWCNPLRRKLCSFPNGWVVFRLSSPIISSFSCYPMECVCVLCSKV